MFHVLNMKCVVGEMNVTVRPIRDNRGEKGGKEERRGEEMDASEYFHFT